MIRPRHPEVHTLLLDFDDNLSQCPEGIERDCGRSTAGALFIYDCAQHGHKATPNNSLVVLIGVWGLEEGGDGPALLLGGQARRAVVSDCKLKLQVRMHFANHNTLITGRE